MDCNTPPMPNANGIFPALSEDWKRCAITQEADGTPFRFKDPDGIIHATIEWPLDLGHPDSIGTTRCGVYDIPPGESWTGRDTLTCDKCFEIEHNERDHA